jgi:dCMP deaminase
MNMALETAQRTNCMKRAVGAVVVGRGRVISTGYNGTAAGEPNCFDGGCKRCNSGESSQGQNLDTCLCVHAEANALLNHSASSLEECFIYCTSFPCLPCAKLIKTVGISVVWFKEPYLSESSESGATNAFQYLTKAGIQCVQIF